MNPHPTHGHLRAKPGLLAPRECNALVLAALGHSAKSAAQVEGISPATVKTYWDSARLKLQARNIAHAVSLAWELGILSSKYLILLIAVAGSLSTGVLDNSDLRNTGRIVRTTKGGRRRDTELAFLPPIIDLPQGAEPAPLTFRQLWAAMAGRAA